MRIEWPERNGAESGREAQNTRGRGEKKVQE
jgi:hypothetical protein